MQFIHFYFYSLFFFQFTFLFQMLKNACGKPAGKIERKMNTKKTMRVLFNKLISQNNFTTSRALF